jgi:ankyrin repeat protein
MSEEKDYYMSSDYKFFKDNELDNALFWEFNKPEIDKEKVRELIAQGANINAVSEFLDNNILISAIAYQDWHEINLDALQFLLDLGVINYTYEGTNCLYMACLTQDVELVEFLLKAGANPNCRVEPHESLLDWAVFEEGLFEIDGYEKDRKNMEDIILILRKYGAEHWNESYREAYKDGYSVKKV